MAPFKHLREPLANQIGRLRALHIDASEADLASGDCASLQDV
jgi:hypothetical protein